MPANAYKDAIRELTPQMSEYAGRFSDSGSIDWVPYIMYFHPPGHRSKVVNTDHLGFRLATCANGSVSVGDPDPHASVNVLAGSSTAFGIGASSDGATLPSRLNAHSDEGEAPWINMGGRSHNSFQELALHILSRHRLPGIDRVVIFSGVNDLLLARLPAHLRAEGGGFFLCRTFYEALEERRDRRWSTLPRRARSNGDREEKLPSIDEQVDHAASLTRRHLAVWRDLAEAAGIDLTYVLQPLAGWVRDEPAQEEAALFDQLDEKGNFGETYGDVSRPEVGRRLARLLRQSCEELGVRFVDMTPMIAAELGPSTWMFVDRIHFTDYGYDLTARLIRAALA